MRNTHVVIGQFKLQMPADGTLFSQRQGQARKKLWRVWPKKQLSATILRRRRWEYEAKKPTDQNGHVPHLV